MSHYQVAEVCPNGHVSTDAADAYPAHREKFCSKCGEETMMQCPSCNSNIRGDFYAEGVIGFGSTYEPPAFCLNCGKPFPWTERKISSAIELVEVGGSLTGEELTQFKEDLEELTKDSPRVQVASLRFKNAMAKAGSSIAGGVREIVVGVLSEAAKKAIWGE